MQTVTISSDLLDLMVNGLTRLPYADVVPIFTQLAEELAENAEPTPQIIARK